MFTRLALYAALGLVLDAIGQDITTAGFWCVVGLFIANEHLSRVDLLEQINNEVNELMRKDKEKRND